MPLSSRSFPETSLPIRPGPSPTLGVWRRGLLSVVVLAWATPLVLAGWLRPDPSGLGTHHQLGLPPCSVRWIAGVRCPSCGMTTAWSHAVRGQWLSAVRCNAGGALLAAVSMVGCAWLAGCIAVGRWWPAVPDDRWILAPTLTVLAVTLVDWSCRLLAG